MKSRFSFALTPALFSTNTAEIAASREEKTSNSFVEKVKEIVSSRVAFLVGLVSEKGK